MIGIAVEYQSLSLIPSLNFKLSYKIRSENSCIQTIVNSVQISQKHSLWEASNTSEIKTGCELSYVYEIRRLFRVEVHILLFFYDESYTMSYRKLTLTFLKI